MTENSSEVNSIQFFGRGDIFSKVNEKYEVESKITSEYPCWYYDVSTRELQEDIAEKERLIEQGHIKDDMSLFITDLENQKRRLEAITSSRPKLNSKQKDELYKTYKDLAKKIQENMPNRLDMHRGTVHTHKQFRKDTDKHIPINTRQYKMFKNLGVKPVNGKISGKEAEKAYKIVGSLLGENTMTERLRRDHGKQSYQSERSLDEMIAEGTR